ncbi:hypothetical protein HanXRQr2_Chr09g0403731 [Helianthus annuus]|uniref:Uncharacterized protein n=1 Tax=Helianthus annuus TaxID=4232 RepID=A0A251TXZ3_HELAN|nr:hypothetical protein HanXRQr2_Chr09g0403731 [Helianthus annuus]KAJ0894492.1 hypothetical protein HanPSC8_Chr09g0389631 [Helianthus annuus]
MRFSHKTLQRGSALAGAAEDNGSNLVFRLKIRLKKKFKHLWATRVIPLTRYTT